MSELISGPWECIEKLTGSEGHRGFSVFDSKGWAFAEVMPVDIGGERGAARARLIAAAPDLLKALQEVAHVIEFEHLLHPDYGWKEWLDETIAPAIAKATGETNDHP